MNLLLFEFVFVHTFVNECVDIPMNEFVLVVIMNICHMTCVHTIQTDSGNSRIYVWISIFGCFV